jgi:hypothetical protein
MEAHHRRQILHFAALPLLQNGRTLMRWLFGGDVCP